MPATQGFRDPLLKPALGDAPRLDAPLELGQLGLRFDERGCDAAPLALGVFDDR